MREPSPSRRRPRRRLLSGCAIGACGLHAIAVVAAIVFIWPAGSGAAQVVERGTTGARPLDGKVVVIDPGHNGENWSHPQEINRQVWIGNGRKACDTTGTSTNAGYAEHRFTWDVATRLRAELRRRGARVVLTRPNNTGWGPCITRRAAIGNRERADAAISIHADGGPASGHGFHVIRPRSMPGLTDDIARDSRVLATDVRAALRRLGLLDANYIGRHGIDVRGDLGGLNLSDVPKVFVEAGNMRNTRDARRLTRPRHRQRLAVVLADALQANLT